MEIKGVTVQIKKVFCVNLWLNAHLWPFFRQLTANMDKRLSCTSDCGMPITEAIISKVAVTNETRVPENNPRGTISFPAVSRVPFPKINAPRPKSGDTKIKPGLAPRMPAPNNGPTALPTLFVPMAKAT